MSKKHPQLNHSRNLDLFAGRVGRNAVGHASSLATVKQKRFLAYLKHVCEENNVAYDSCSTFDDWPFSSARKACAEAIEKNLKNLKEAGITVREEETVETEVTYPDGTKEKLLVKKKEWIPCTDMLPAETEIPECSRKAVAKKYKVREPVTMSATVATNNKVTPQRTIDSSGRIINGKWASEDGLRYGDPISWRPLY